MESRKEMETAMERLSSGKRINSSSDDAAGLAIATRMDSQVRGLNMAIRNANDGISVVQSAEGAMQQVTEMLQRMRELAVQSTSGANNAIDRASLDQEVQQLKAEIDRIASSTTFNSKNLLDGSFSSNIQVGYELGDTLGIAIGSVDTASLGIGTGTSSSGGGSVVSGRVNFSTSTVIEAGDIVLNGVALGGFNGASTDTTDIGTTNNNIADFVDLVNNADAGVGATAFNRVVASNVGTGIVGANELAIKVGAVGTTGAQEAIIGSSNSMEEMVSNINLAMGGSVIASLDDGGRLVLSNTTGASISIADSSSTVAGVTNAGSGFTVEVEATTDIAQYATEFAAGGAITNPINYSANEFNGFIQLTSTNGEDITLARGNEGLTSPGTLADLAAAGFREISESPDGQPYSTTGLALTSGGVAGVIAKGDITLNGVEIYEATLSNDSDSFQGKLDLINAFQTETGVIASAYFEKTFDFSNVTFISGINFDINGTAIAMSSTLASTVANINAATSAHGLQATINGQNVKLVGNNVQHVQIDNFEYDIDDDFEAEISAMADKTDVAGTARTVSLANLNFTAGLTLTMTFGTGGIINNVGGGASQLLTGDGRVVSYTVESGDSQLDIANGFRQAINDHILAGDSRIDTTGTSFSVGRFISTYEAAGDATMFFRTTMSMGSAVLQFSVTLPTDGYKAFSATESNFGALRLTSLNDTPIQIDLGSGSAVAEHGLLEMNVGAADYDNIDPSMGTTVLVSGLSVSTQSGAESALTVLDQAIVQVGINRAQLGAIENRLDHTVSNLANVVENTEAAKSRIQDADFAYESAQLARAQILQQAGTAMLAQANAAPQNVLSLLG
jgi:flagellin